MKGDTGPHINTHWLEGCPQWIERHIYIVERAEAYLDHYLDNPDYDFTQSVGKYQTAAEAAYKGYATGLTPIEEVAAQVRMLRIAFRRTVSR